MLHRRSLLRLLTAVTGMVFSSLKFVLCFLPLVVLATWAARRLAGARAVIALMLVASFAFYAYWDWRFLPLLLLSIGANYFCARQLILRETRRRPLLIAGGRDGLAQCHGNALTQHRRAEQHA